MQHIELQNSQNVSVQFETASLLQRMGAFLVDLIIIVMTSIIMLILLTFLTQDLFSETSNIIIALSTVGFYTLINEYIFNGSTPGKRAFSLKVVSLDGEPLFFAQLFTRWASRFIDIWLSLGTVGMVFISGNQTGQRLGDLFAGTSVIKTRNSMLFRLVSLQTLPDRENFSGKYPEVVLLNEQEVLLIKKLLDSYYLSGRNKHYSEMIFACVNQVCRKMGIQRPDIDSQLFLKAIIKDFIILTR